jgi:hypothetical protein
MWVDIWESLDCEAVCECEGEEDEEGSVVIEEDGAGGV